MATQRFIKASDGPQAPRAAVVEPVASPDGYQVQLYVSSSGRTPVRDVIADLDVDHRKRLGLAINAAGRTFGKMGQGDACPVQACKGLWELRLSKETGHNWRAIAMVDEADGKAGSPPASELVILHLFNKKTNGKVSATDLDTAVQRQADWMAHRNQRRQIIAATRRARCAASVAKQRAILQATTPQDGLPGGS